MAPQLKKCDLVMEGGITSGIVYPKLVSKLATEYRFSSIGGTSAGAIAACLAAAAEYARQNGRSTPDPFAEIEAVPAWLGAKSKTTNGSNLFNLFQPQPGMRGLFDFAVAFLVKSWPLRIWLWLKVFWFEILIGLFPGAALLYVASVASGWRFTLAALLAFLVAIAGSVVTAIVGILLRAARLPTRHFGLCTGFERQHKSRAPTLIEWLNGQINAIAGKDPKSPLTFADLRAAGVNLRMVTTCLTWGRPFTLPFESDDLFFRPSEFSRFFPKEVVDFLVAVAPTLTPKEKIDLTGFVPLPKDGQLPVIVAARLSLSFPILFCAVPLYGLDFTRRRREPAEPPPPTHRIPGDALASNELQQPERVWFTDGGMTSNFPLHLFDNPLPRWPTFAVNLRSLRPDLKDPNDRVWMPTKNLGGIAQIWNRLSTEARMGGAFAFVFCLIDSARNWNDTLQTIAPGYRDRVVHISLNDVEGGLNLNMPDPVVTALSLYGEAAAQKLIDRFIHGLDNGKPTVMTWNNQRWIRYRSSLALLENFFFNLAESLDHPEPGDQSYFDLINRGPNDPPSSYRLQPGQTEYCHNVTDALRGVAAKMTGKMLQDGTPKPQPNLRIRPNF